jgi:hypothetical protein
LPSRVETLSFSAATETKTPLLAKRASKLITR